MGIIHGKMVPLRSLSRPNGQLEAFGSANIMIYRVRYLISQEGHEIYIPVASFDNTYLQWLRSKRAISLPKDSFLNMARYGPWLIDRAEHVAEFAAIILAIMVAK